MSKNRYDTIIHITEQNNHHSNQGNLNYSANHSNHGGK